MYTATTPERFDNPVTNINPNPMLPVPHRIERVRRETRDTFTLELAPVSGAAIFSPGQFNMLYVFGAGESAISISGHPGRPEKLVHTVRAVGVVTRAMRKLKRGDSIGVRGPFGAGWPVDFSEGRDVVLVTGGIGLAPLRPVIYHVLANREKYGKLVLLYGARTPADLLYTREFETWRRRPDTYIDSTVDAAGRDWRGNVGVVTRLIPRADFDAANAIAMICGPEIMMRYTVAEMQKRGVSLDRIFVSMERNMKCAVVACGHCQYGPHFLCSDGPVLSFDRISELFGKREI
jgi:NAD(P)H-flavin reductase